MVCEMVYGNSNSKSADVCGRPAITACFDCDKELCHNCATPCCGVFFCDYCLTEHQHEKHQGVKVAAA
jgi:hypothetical protein